MFRNVRTHGLAAVILLAGSLARSEVVPLPEPRDVEYPGTLQLRVDASDVDHRVVRVHQSIPVESPGLLILLYPRWLPGNHSTTGPVEMLAGLEVRTEAGALLEWRRDDEKMYAFLVDVPQGAGRLDVRFQFLTPVVGDQGRQVMTPDLLGLQWEKALLYPAGHYADRILVAPIVTLPPGWQFASALDGAIRIADTVHFDPLPLARLVDSPLFAGAHYRRIELDPDAKGPVRLNVFADRATELAATPVQVALHRRVVREALALFGARHYRHYDFLLAISDQFSNIGLEHHESSENGVPPGYFIDWAASGPSRDLLPHELVHSWNGKFRRPADLWTPSYEVPMRTSLLWVYEGLTEYWGIVLATRSGLWSPAYTRDTLAHYAAAFELGRAGRRWRNLQDTTHQPVISYRGTQSYPSWQRSRDYYTEGALLWLDVDTRLQEITRGRRSLDDFARAFFGVRDGQVAPLTYTFADVAAGLDAIAPGDWASWLRARLDSHGPGAPLDGLERGGWKVVYGDEPNEATSAIDAANESDAFMFSLGIALDRSGKVTEVYWDSPGFVAGLAPGMTVVAVNDRAYSADLLREAVRAAKDRPAGAIRLLVRKGATYATVPIDYHDGLRYPRLQRIAGAGDQLGSILAPASRKP